MMVLPVGFIWSVWVRRGAIAGIFAEDHKGAEDKFQPGRKLEK